MSKGKRYPRQYAQVIADAFVEAIEPHCKRVLIAGSLRRGLADVGDIEIVCEPKLSVTQQDLFSRSKDRKEVTLYKALKHIDWIDLRRTQHGKPQAEGDRYQALLDTCTGVPIDLFIVKPPASWGVIATLRTGSADFSADMMRAARRRGFRCEDGHLIHVRGSGEAVDTDEESDFFRVLNIAWVDPERRL